MDRDQITHHDEIEHQDEITDNVPYTEMEHHEDWLDPRDTGDISRPQGWFWHQNERPGADEFMDIEIVPTENPKDRKKNEISGRS